MFKQHRHTTAVVTAGEHQIEFDKVALNEIRHTVYAAQTTFLKCDYYSYK
jgi:hypothetical protein